MALSAGTSIGPYRIVSRLGAGGMGEVYRGRDPRLGRDVAIKALPDTMGDDADRVARFRREAEILASLNHPHIAALYGLEEVGASRFLILELVEGDTLADRLKSGPLPVSEALTIARQAADALEAAHDRGVIHRDLKPANIALTPDGQAKVLDFGLAKALPSVDEGRDRDAPTVTSADTRAGVVLGTASYMSPEQTRGLPVDRRTDVWAFGCVLFEMLTGRLAFPGGTISDAIAAVLERDPDWSLLPPATPERVRWLLGRTLAKDPRHRLHDIADARIELDEAIRNPAPTDSAELTRASVQTRGQIRQRVAWSVATGFLAALIVVPLFQRGRPDSREATDAPRYSTSIVLPENVRLSTGAPAGRFSLSPDGRRLALVATDAAGQSMLWIRPLDSRVPRPLPGTDGASHPFWSPDSRFVAFLAQGKLKKVDAAGGDVTTVADAAFGSTGAWSRDDVILFTPTGNSPIFRVSASSGTPAVAVTTLDAAKGDVQHSYPYFLPDGRRFLFFVVGATGALATPRGVYVGSLDSTEPPKLVVEDGSNAKVANGHILYLRAGALLAQPFDLERLETSGTPMPFVEQVHTTGDSASEVTGAFSVSETGVFAYQAGTVVRSRLTWFDRTGTDVGRLGELADYVDVTLSPDEQRVATSVLDPARGTRDVWIFDVVRGLGERITFGPGDDFGPNWSRPAGDRIVFSSLRKGRIDLYESPPNASGTETLLFEDDLGKFNATASPDGRFLIYVAGGGIISRSEIWMLPRFDNQKATPFLTTPFAQSQPQFSPDGRWVAFMSRKSGRDEVYVTSFPDRQHETRISSAGGSRPRWNRNGTEIFYLDPDNTLVATRVNGRQPASFEVGTSERLFALRPRQARLDAYPYDVASNGQRFLVNTFVDDVTPPITLVVNWMAGR